MPHFSRRYMLVVTAVILCTVSATWLALDRFVPAPPKKITIAAGSKGGAYEFYAHKYRDILAKHRVTLDIRMTEGTIENLKLLEDPKSGVAAGFVQGGHGVRYVGCQCLGQSGQALAGPLHQGVCGQSLQPCGLQCARADQVVQGMGAIGVNAVHGCPPYGGAQ